MSELLDPAAMSQADIAAAWCARLAEGQLPADEQHELDQWLQLDPANRIVLQRMVGLWDGVAEAADSPELLSLRTDALEALRSANRQRWSTRLSARWQPLAGFAACVLMLVMGGFYFLHARPDIYETGIGERRVVRLQDGSRLSLDAATKVLVTYNAERRFIRLSAGRAKFDVAKDPRRPFTVVADDRLVVATGTAFSVELLKAHMRVVLYEGNVAVLEEGPGDEPPKHVRLASQRIAADQALKPGSMLIAKLDRDSAEVTSTDLLRSISWESGQLIFSDEPLAIAVEQVNRYSDTKIAISDDRTAGLLVSGAFNAGDTDSFVEGVSQLYALNSRRDGDVIALQAGKRR